MVFSALPNHHLCLYWNQLLCQCQQIVKNVLINTHQHWKSVVLDSLTQTVTWMLTSFPNAQWKWWLLWASVAQRDSCGARYKSILAVCVDMSYGSYIIMFMNFWPVSSRWCMTFVVVLWGNPLNWMLAWTHQYCIAIQLFCYCVTNEVPKNSKHWKD